MILVQIGRLIIGNVLNTIGGCWPGCSRRHFCPSVINFKEIILYCAALVFYKSRPSPHNDISRYVTASGVLIAACSDVHFRLPCPVERVSSLSYVLLQAAYHHCIIKIRIIDFHCFNTFHLQRIDQIHNA
jgi:hypothetical protein